MTDELDRKKEHAYNEIFHFSREVVSLLDGSERLPERLHVAIDMLWNALRLESGEIASPVRVVSAAETVIQTVTLETVLPRNLHLRITRLRYNLERYRLAEHEIEQYTAFMAKVKDATSK